MAETDSRCVSIYVEVEYDIYEYHSFSETATRNWVEAAFAQVFLLYADSGITLSIKSMKIHTTPDGYPNDTWNKLM